MIKPEGIGKTLAEFKALHPNMKIRVTAIGETSFVGTCDYRLDRINVKLSSEGLLSETKIHKLDSGREFTETVYPQEERNKAIVLSANIG